MANRILRDWTTSERMDKLSLTAEVFFTRLIMRADDHGCFHANVKLLKAALFPLKDISEKDITKWLNECSAAGIIHVYEVENRQYLKILDFGQRLRNMVSRFPQPAANPLPIDGDKPPEVETETEVETEKKPKDAAAPTLVVWPSFEDFWDKYDKKEDRIKCEKKFQKINQEAREKIMHHLDAYILSTPDKQYRKNPITYLNNQAWENEVIFKSNGNGQTKQDQRTADLAADWLERNGAGTR